MVQSHSDAWQSLSWADTARRVAALAEALRGLGLERCDRVLLDWRTQQPAGFRPLRFVPARMVVSLGLVSTAAGEPQSPDDLLRLIDQASRVVPLEQLAISPRCGFASSQVGSAITHDDQWRRLELVAELAREVWP